MRQENETLIQQRIVEFVNNNHCMEKHNPRLFLHSVPNGISFTMPPQIPKQFHNCIRLAIGVSVKITELIGMRKGVSDLLIHGISGRCLCVEVKNSTNSQDPAQIDFQRIIKHLGGRYILVRSLDDFKKQFSENLDWLTKK